MPATGLGGAGADGAAPAPGGGRRVDYLRDRRVLVVGTGTAAATAAGVLESLGATVTRRAAGGPGPADARDHDVVVDDRVAAGCDAGYLDAVGAALAARTGEGGATPGAWVTVSAFGLSGPARAFRGSELVCAAAGGLLAAVFDEDGAVFPIPGAQALQAVGHLAGLAAVHAIFLARTRSGSIHLDLSAQEAVAFCTNQQTPSHVIHKCGIPPGLGRYSAPSGPFPCTDGQAQVIVVDNHQFAKYSEAIGRPDWIPIFPQVADRVASAEMIDVVTAEWTSQRSKIDCEEYLQSRGVASTAVRSVDELLGSAQFQARGWPGPVDPPADQVVVPALVGRRTGPAGPERGPSGPSAPTVPGRDLSELHVVEVSNVLAGPLTGAILGAMGADVARVEGTERMDLYRQNGPFAGGIAGIERGAYFQGANFSKRSVTEAVAHAHPAGLRRWLDVVIENVGLKRVEEAGVPVDPNPAGRPSLSLSISAFGRSGPSASYRGYAQNVHAFAGLEDAILGVAGHPVTIRTVIADYSSAVWAATLVSAWWLGGAGRGQRVDLAMTEVIAARMLRYEAGYVPSERTPTTDLVVRVPGAGHLALSIPGPDVGPALSAVGVPAGATTEGDLRAHIESKGASAAAGVVADLQRAGIAAYLTRSPEGLITDDQLAARRYFMRMDHPVIGDGFHMCLPWQEASGSRRAWYRRAPLLGEDDEWAARSWREPAEGASVASPVGADAGSTA